jgi:hypothetical protein
LFLVLLTNEKAHHWSLVSMNSSRLSHQGSLNCLPSMFCWSRRNLEQDPFLIKALERLVLLRVLTTICIAISSERINFQVFSDLLNAVAWSFFLLRISWTLICRYPSFWWLAGLSGSTLIEKIQLNLSFRYRRLHDLTTQFLSVIQWSCEALKTFLPRCRTNFVETCSLKGPSDHMEHAGIEMKMRMASIPTYRAPSRMTVDRGETRQSARDKDL